jgi:hypothetical protein
MIVIAGLIGNATARFAGLMCEAILRNNQWHKDCVPKQLNINS